MNEKLLYLSITGAILIIVFGTILHFVYEWSDKNTIVAIFSPVNESVWEHLKLLFWPSLIFAILEFFYIGKYYNNYIPAKVISLYIGLLMIIALFYTYTGILGTNYLAADIAIFIISVIISQFISYKIITSEISFGVNGTLIAIIALLLLIATFVIFTFQAPEIPLFKDPINGSYGINYVQ